MAVSFCFNMAPDLQQTDFTLSVSGGLLPYLTTSLETRAGLTLGPSALAGETPVSDVLRLLELLMVGQESI